MTLEYIFYTDVYTKKIAVEIAKKNKIKADFFKISNPTFTLWKSHLIKHAGLDIKKTKRLIPNSILIGGNRWRHHYALNLTDLPILVIDAHTDMSYDEMIVLKLVRPYNWIYFKILTGIETHLILPYDNFKWKRWDIIVPKTFVDRFYLYSFNRAKGKVDVSLSLRHFKTTEVRNPFKIYFLSDKSKQISLDFDITREISEDKVGKLMNKLFKAGDVCDLWLDEGKRGDRKTLNDHIESCTHIFNELNYS